jgi:hypothetical protein
VKPHAKAKAGELYDRILCLATVGETNMDDWTRILNGDVQMRDAVLRELRLLMPDLRVTVTVADSTRDGKVHFDWATQ